MKDSWHSPRYALFASNPSPSLWPVADVLRPCGHTLFCPKRSTRNIFDLTGSYLSVLALPAKLPLSFVFCLPTSRESCHPRPPGVKKNCFQVLRRSVKRCPTRRFGLLSLCSHCPITMQLQYRCKRQTRSGVGLPIRALVLRHGKHSISRVTGLK